ncbi:hypothetical protein EK21DRAFT_62071 [Setomelanomma holmii]|uniref:C2H2-type domain-containing protein n=1 Tax=Setomelanomma holmii TaxID=210430 RepID=A0A9P4HC83_9PLEO|nr:hypothetical protein EK21DRAFT_62071 [Setomelanomma holmii]
MDGTNAAGRKVSLLNDNGPSSHHFVRATSITPSLPSRTSSYLGSPCHSPPTPQLVRSNSSDSNTMQSPSPITPDYNYNLYDAMDRNDLNHHDLDEGSDEFASSFLPPQPVLPYHPSQATRGAYFAQQPMSEEQATSPTAPASANGRKKNTYPCPLAARYNCNDFFTTSGHAARHAKKHTGKKDSFCPECNKAFTRKDNMEQHRRTHQNGRSAAKGGDRDVRKTKQSARTSRPKSTPLQPVQQSDLPAPLSPLSPTSSFMVPAVQRADSFSDFTMQAHYPDPSNYSMVQPYPREPASADGALMQLASTAINASEKETRESR